MMSENNVNGRIFGIELLNVTGDESVLSAEENQYWNDMCDRLGSLFRLSAEEEQRVRANRLIQMLALLPGYANCPDPRGTGFLMAVTYVSERKAARDLFAHDARHDADLLSRLAPFSRLLEGGDPQIIEKGLNLAALTMLKDYASDAQSDQRKGKYNPVALGVWNFQELKNRILQRDMAIACPGLDRVYSVKTAERHFWAV